MSPRRPFATSSPSAFPIARHSSDAEALSLLSIIAVAYDFSVAVSSRPASCAWSSSAARMSTLTMLAVSKAPSPYEALSPDTMSSTATATSTPSGTSTAPMAVASNSSRSTAGRATDFTETSSLAEGVTAAADDTACARAWTYTVPAAVAPTTATAARAPYSSERLPGGRARRLRRALEDSMPRSSGRRLCGPLDGR